MAPPLRATPSRRILSVLVFTPWLCEARSWVQVIDTSIYESALIDPYRSAFSFESTDLLSTADGQPSLLPTSAPLASIIAAPTLSPTSLAPSMSPSQSVECLAEAEVLYTVQLLDSWGDGWSGTQLEISMEIQSVFSARSPKNRATIFDGTLSDGATSEAFVCLSPNVCYDLFAGGGKWEDEVKWSIREAFDERTIEDGETPITLVKGSAPMTCQFSIPSADGSPSACPVSCLVPTESPTPAPTSFPSDIPTGIPTERESDQPSSVPSPRSADQEESSDTARAPSTTIALKAGSIVQLSSASPTSFAPLPSGDIDGELMLKPSIFVPSAAELSDPPSQVPSSVKEVPSPSPTGGDAVVAIESRSAAPTGGDAKITNASPTLSPTRFFSVRVGENDWIWPTSKLPTVSPTDNTNDNGPNSEATDGRRNGPNSEAPESKAPNSKAPNSQAPRSSAAPSSEAPTTVAEPTKSPSVSRSTHFFLSLQENLAAIKEEEEEEEDSLLVSDYPSGAPSVRRGFFA